MKLKPCPFCGSHDIVIVGVGHDHFARCDDCGVETPGGYGGKRGWPDRKNWAVPHPSYSAETEEAAMAAWNRRAEPLKGAYTQEMTDAFTDAQFRGISAETQAQLDAIDDNIRAAHMMASTTFVGGRITSAQVVEHQPTPTENETRA